MNIALIFAGGTGQRMNSKSTPKQFLKLHSKPIIVYTIEQFNDHPEIDGIVVACLASHINYMEQLKKQFSLDKIKAIVPGGATGQESIYNGLAAIEEHFPADSTVLVHDGVRPLIDDETISACIECVEKHGNAITVVSAQETVVADCKEGMVGEILNRSRCQMARAPQCFKLNELIGCHRKAREENRDDFIDSASIMQNYGYELYTVEGKRENIKITTPMDFYIFRAIIDVRENSQIFGL